MPFDDFAEKIQSESGSHFKNKFFTFLLLNNAEGTAVIDDQEHIITAEKFFLLITIRFIISKKLVLEKEW